MNRIVGYTFIAAALLVPAPEVRGDILVSTIDPVTFQPSGIRRYDEWTGTPLPVGDIAAASTEFGVPAFPSDMTVTPDGRLFVADSGGVVLQFDAATGTPLPHPSAPLPAGVFAVTSTAEPQVGFPSLALGPDSLLYVLDGDDVSGTGGKPGIRIYDPDTGASMGTLLESATVEFGRLTSIAFDTAGDLLMSDYDNGTIYKIDVANDSLAPFITVGETDPAFSPAGIFVRDTGDIYIANAVVGTGSNIDHFDPDGSNRSVFATLAPAPSESGSFPANMSLNRAGDELLAGTLGFGSPTSGQVFSINFSGSTAVPFLTGIPSASSVIIVPDLLPGDFNGDGTVDNADYVKWQDDFGTTVTPTSGADGNGDGLVNLADYTIWRDTLGATGIAPPLGQFVTQIPEPASLLLTLAASMLWLRRKRLPRAA